MTMQQVQYELPVGKEVPEEYPVEVEPAVGITEDVLEAKPETTVVKEDTTTEETEVITEPSEDEFDIEVEDDTPPEDRGRTPSDPPEEITEEEMVNYSEKANKRIKHFSKGYHDERRAKEKAVREKDELVALTKNLMEENDSLKGTVGKNRTILLEQAKRTISAEVNAAKQEYKTAYESGEPDAVLAAQEKLTTATIRADKLANIKAPPLQEKDSAVQIPEGTQTSQRDPQAEEWAKNNTWFGDDDEMTSFALGVHNKLVTKEGLDPKSNEYYDRINGRMREVFPSKFDDVAGEKAPSVVAPVTRSNVPKKVKLTRTQVAIAKELGISIEDYAAQVAADMQKEAR